MDSKVIWALALTVLAFVITGIIASIGGTIISGVQNTQTSSAVYNDSITFTTGGVGYAFTSGNTPVLSVYNVSNTTVECKAGNYTYNATHIVLVASKPCVEGKLYWVGYTGTSYPTPYWLSNNATRGLQNIGNQLPLIGTIIVFGAVIALLLVVFWFRGKSQM
jgi:hypothetical protein